MLLRGVVVVSCLAVFARFVLALKTTLCAHSERSGVYFQNAPIRHGRFGGTRELFESTHGSVLGTLSLCLYLSRHSHRPDVITLAHTFTIVF